MTSGDVQGTRAVYVFDDLKPFCAAYNTNGEDYEIRMTVVAGEIIVPYRATDTFASGTMAVRYDPGNNPVADSHYVYTDGGVSILVEDRFDTNFSRTNVPFGDGRYPWDVVLLNSATYYKGFIDSDVVRVMGASDRQAYVQFDGGQFIKLHDQLCFPYAPNQPSFPYPDPTGIP